MQKYTTIKGLTDQRRLPRIERVKLGLKVKNKKGVLHPFETDYFVIPKELQKLYGEKPKEIDVMLVTNNKDETCPAANTLYGSGVGVKCKGDGVTASQKQPDGTWKQIECPCEQLKKEKGGCNPTGHFMFMLPRYSMGGVFQISTKSINSIIDIRSCMDYIESLLGCSCAMLPFCPDLSAPLRLRRIKTETHHDGKKQIHHTLQLIFQPRNKDGEIMETAELIQFISMIQKRKGAMTLNYFLLPDPEEINPEQDPTKLIEEKGIKDEEDMEEAEVIEGESKTVEEPAKKRKLSEDPKVNKEQRLHLACKELGLDAHKEYKVKSLKDLSEEALDTYLKAIDIEVQEHRGKKYKREQETQTPATEGAGKPKETKPDQKATKEEIPGDVSGCWFLIYAKIKELQLNKSEEVKNIVKEYGSNLTLQQLQEICKDYIYATGGE